MKIKDIIFEEQELNEITRPDTQKEAVQWLIKHGYEQIGNGLYANVLHKGDSQHVLKLYSSDDRGYNTFLQLVHDNPSKYFPRFRGKVMQINSDYNAIRMEKLNAINYSYRIGGYRVIDAIIEAVKFFRWRPKNNIKKFLSDYRDTSTGDFFSKDENRELLNICYLLGKECRSSALYPDLHSGNIMLRQNGDLVFTDPLLD